MRLRRGEDPDVVVAEWEGDDGSTYEADLTLEQAAALKRGRPVAGYGLVRRHTLADQIAGVRARLEGLRAARDEMRREFPGIEDGEWSD